MTENVNYEYKPKYNLFIKKIKYPFKNNIYRCIIIFEKY